MNKFLGNLPQESRVIFLRRYWFCDTIAEIAERYGISESKVKMRLHRTRLQLADFLSKVLLSLQKGEDISALSSCTHQMIFYSTLTIICVMP